MNLAYFLPLGGSLESLKQTGQDRRFIDGELSYYLKKFQNIYIFDYSNIRYVAQNKRIIQIRNSHCLHRFIYASVMPLIHRRVIKDSAVIRVSHLMGVIPAIVCKIFYGKNFIYNFAYDYVGFAWKEKKYLQSWLLKILASMAPFFSKGIIFANKTLGYDDIYHRSGRVFIPNGVDTKIFQPASARSEHQKKRYEILFIGRLVPQKNILNLLDAIKSLNFARIKLTFIGEGELADEVKKRCEKDKINLLMRGRIENEELPTYYQRANLFVLPSFYEGSAKVLLEAMSCGSVCLVSRIPENREIIKEGINGFLCGTTAREIGNKIKYIMTLPKDKIRQIKINARKTIEENYSLVEVMEREVEFVLSFCHSGIGRNLK